MSDLDPDLAEQLRAAADSRIRQRIADAARRREQQATIRNAFAERRQAGVERRNTARAARLRLIQHHDNPDITPPDAA